MSLNALSYSTASLKETAEILEFILTTEEVAHHVPMLIGEPGAGKTAIVSQVGRRLGYTVRDYILSQIKPEDINGIPFPHAAGFSKFHPAYDFYRYTNEAQPVLKRLHDQEREALAKIDPAAAEAMGEYEIPDKVILFLDELPNASPDVVAAAHPLLFGRRFGLSGHTLLPGVRMMAAGNLREHGADVFDMSVPAKTRMSPILMVKPLSEEWLEWGRMNSVDPMILAFLHRRPELMSKLENLDSPLPPPTRRGWEFASNIARGLARPDRKQYVKHQVLMLEGTIGRGPAVDFTNFAEIASKAPSPEDIATRPLEVPSFNDELNLAYVCTEMMLHAARNADKLDWPVKLWGNSPEAQEAAKDAIRGKSGQRAEDARIEAVRKVSVQKMVDGFLAYSDRMHPTLKALLHPEFLNLSFNMPDSVMEATLNSDHVQTVLETSERMERVTKGSKRTR